MSDYQKEINQFQITKAEKELDLEDQIKVVAQFLGYKRMPVDIDTFMDDPYYMGLISKNLYPFWRDLLRKIFPTPIHTSTPILVFTGAIGTGKSTAVRFMFDYMKHRIECLTNPYDTFEFVPGKNIKFSYFHKTSKLAYTDFIEVMDQWESTSPYFKEVINEGKLDLIEQVADSIRSNNNIGSDVLCYNLSELNFVPYEKAHDKLNDALKRWSSRFERILNYFGLCIIDTSAQNDDSIADDFIVNNPYGDKVRAVHTNRWIVRKHLNYYGRKGWFDVYIGDGTHQPFIVNPSKGRIITPDMDPDRILKVPEECRADFEFDLVTALQDIGGISISASDRFFPDTTNLVKCFNRPQYTSDIVKFDFYDKTDKLVYRFARSLDEIPPNKIIYIRYDIGVTGDNTGLAIAYFDKFKIYDSDKKVRQPMIEIPLAVGINRYEDEETPIYHLFEFVMDLHQRFEVGCFTADQYASRQLFQDLTREKVPNEYLSVDRNNDAYIYAKSLANAGLLSIASNGHLKSEMCDLRWIGRKVDHPATGCFIGSTEVIVLTPDGITITKTLQELVLNYHDYKVLSYKDGTYQWELIQRVFSTKSVNKLVKLEFESGDIYYCTPDHLILTSTGYIKASELTEDLDIISVTSPCDVK